MKKALYSWRPSCSSLSLRFSFKRHWSFLSNCRVDKSQADKKETELFKNSIRFLKKDFSPSSVIITALLISFCLLSLVTPADEVDSELEKLKIRGWIGIESELIPCRIILDRGQYYAIYNSEQIEEFYVTNAARFYTSPLAAERLLTIQSNRDIDPGFCGKISSPNFIESI